MRAMRRAKDSLLKLLKAEPEKRYFLGNLNECAKNRLRPGGTDVTAELEHEGVKYIGAWVTQACAKKVWRRCEQHGDPNHAFELFYRVSFEEVVQIEASNIPAYLGVPASKPKKSPGRRQQNFGQFSHAPA